MNKSSKRSKIWTDEEISFLKENYPIKGSAFCAEKLSYRTIESVRIKANRLHLDRDIKARYNQIDVPDGYKHCPSCKQILSESFFYRKQKDLSYSDILYPLCRSCAQEKARRNYRTHKSSSKARYKLNPEKRLFGNLKCRAKIKGIPFSIEVEDIVIPSVCPVLGIDIIPFSDSDNSPSIDKLIPEKGYVKGNINVISKRANLIKTNATLEEIEMVAAWLRGQIHGKD